MQHTNGKPILSTQAVTKRFGKRLHFGGDRFFDMPSGVIYGISGANGSGKSVFLRVLCGLIPSDEWAGKEDTRIEGSGQTLSSRFQLEC